MDAGEAMTETLELAFHEASKLSPEAQDNLAMRWLAELADEHQWDGAFANSQDLLAELAAEALAEHDAGLTEALDPERL